MPLGAPRSLNATHSSLFVLAQNEFKLKSCEHFVASRGGIFRLLLRVDFTDLIVGSSQQPAGSSTCWKFIF